jgi:hypothetical protein
MLMQFSFHKHCETLRINKVWKFSSYRTENMLGVHYDNQPVNAV